MSDASLSNSSSSSTSIFYFGGHNDVINQIANNDPKVKSLAITKPGVVMVQEDPNDLQYIIQGNRDEGLISLGQAIGKNKHLSHLILDGNGLERTVDIKSFFSGLSHNKSIYLIELYSFRGINVISLLSPFFYGNRNLAQLKINYCTLGKEGCELLALIISTCIGSLTGVGINSGINQGHSDEGLAVIIQALKVRPQLLQDLCIGDNIGWRTLKVLESLLHYTTKLRYLSLHSNVIHEVVSDNMSAILTAAMKCKLLHGLNLWQRTPGGLDIGEEGIDVLANALPNSNLSYLYLAGINGGSGERVEALAVTLPMSNLVSLNLSKVDIGESSAKALACALKADPLLEILMLNSSGIRVQGYLALADALTNNTHLTRVDLSNCTDSPILNDAITAGCWQAFLNTLCDTSTVNKTYLSNHTLEKIRLHTSHEVSDSLAPRDVVSVLRLNRCADKGLVAVMKILKYHRHFDIQPFVQWDYKVLPLLVGWLERAVPFDANGTVEMRKLTVVYEFIQALPELFVLTYSLQELSLLRYEQSRRRMYQMQADPDLDSRIAQVEHRLAML